MKTPAGIECSYFYGDYHRGRNWEECRLLGNSWSRDLCRTCPVPAIERANACEHMRLRPRLSRPLTAGLRRRVRVEAYCERTGRRGFDPHIGCGDCHPLPPAFEVKE
ncbi:MAG: hypothetical protein ABWK53_10910 [Anaerolineales bacterium]